MNLTEEIITKEVIEQNQIVEEIKVITQGNVDSLSEIEDDGKSFVEKYGVDPLGMCEECERLGFCKRDVILEDAEISNWVPIKAMEQSDYWRDGGKYSRAHLQAAFDAYHQQDYETAIINCKAVIELNNELPLPLLVIAVCYYFLNDYTEAIIQYELYLKNLDYTEEELFKWHCENKLRTLEDTLEDNYEL